MKNNLLPQKAKIIKRTQENEISVCFRLQFEEEIQEEFEFLAGQFLVVGVPGFGEAAFTLSSNPKDSRDYFEICVRQVGELTTKINQQQVGDYLQVRGPFGNGFPLVKQNLILIGGGCGFIPLKSVLVENLDRQDIHMQTFLGCKNTTTLYFANEYPTWKSKFDFNIILEEAAFQGFSSSKGFVTDLIKKTDLLTDPMVFICGPEVMYKFVVQELLKKNIKPENIFLSFERRMHCGVGVCQHCACGEKYICKDGPVFSYPDSLKWIKF
jgi:NAD(P)H-flavin reductase